MVWAWLPSTVEFHSLQTLDVLTKTRLNSSCSLALIGTDQLCLYCMSRWVTSSHLPCHWKRPLCPPLFACLQSLRSLYTFNPTPTPAGPVRQYGHVIHPATDRLERCKKCGFWRVFNRKPWGAFKIKVAWKKLWFLQRLDVPQTLTLQKKKKNLKTSLNTSVGVFLKWNKLHEGLERCGHKLLLKYFSLERL